MIDRAVRNKGLHVILSLIAIGMFAATSLADDEDSEIRVSRQKIDYLPRAYCYASLQDNARLEVITDDREEVLRRTQDSGKTWKELNRRTFLTDLTGGLVRDRYTTNLFLDPKTGRIVRILCDIESSRGGEVIDTRFRRKIYFQTSVDEGVSWSPETQLVQQGAGYDAEHYARDVYYGRTSASPACTGLMTLRDGTVILPFYFWPDSKYVEKLPPTIGRECGGWYLQACCFLGKWQKEGQGLDWNTGRYMVVNTVGSPCGTDEPTLVELTNGSILMISRHGGMYKDEKRRRHSYTHYAISEDGARSWKQIRRLTYSDGSELYTPSSITKLIRSTKNGKLYWIANLMDHPNYGQGDPRHPLHMAEVDEKTLSIKRETVTIIEDKSPDDPDLVRFSNFNVYENRDSLDFVLTMQKDYSELVEGNPPRPNYRYDIRLP